jgi:hypothetical protein
MRTIITSVMLIAGTALLALAQPSKPLTNNPQSPAKETSVTINGKKIGVWYHAPSVRGRKMFGGSDAMQKDGTVWRLGANEATWFHTDGDLMIGDVAVPAGDYTLYIDLDAGKWKLIVNKQTGQWGINRDGSTSDDPGKEVGRAAMTMSKPPSTVETLKINLAGTGGNKGLLQAEFENVVASVPFTVK